MSGPKKFMASGATNAKRIWWRGQADAKWSLLPSVYRPEQNYTLVREQNRIFRFRQLARTRYSTCLPDDQVDLYLFLMQHYGLPTRLLDWTESPLTALFFAVSGDGELKYRPAVLFFQEPFDRSQEHLNRVIAVAAPEIDVRMIVQSAAFTVHGSQIPLDELPGCEQFLIKFEILAEHKTNLKELLGLLGVRESSLFPDLAHLARELVAND